MPVDQAQDRLRVLIISRIFPNAVEPLAAPFNRQQFTALGKLCHVEVLAGIPWFPGAGLARKWSNAGRLLDVPLREEIGGLAVEHPRIPYLPKYGHVFSGALMAGALLPAALRRRKAFDVVLASWAYPDGAAGVAVARLLGLPLVIKVHGTDLNVLSTMRGPALNLRWALPRAERLVAVSASLGDVAAGLGMPRDRIVIVPNGIDASIFHPRDPAAARRELGLAEGGRLILYCGRLEQAKGVFDLLDAFALFQRQQPDITLALLGDGSARGEVEARAREFGDRVKVLGGRPLPEVPVWMGAADVVTLPSWAEGSPNVIREAMACGRPVVASNVGGIPELVTSPEVGRLVSAKDPPALAAALVEAAGTRWDAEAIARNGSGNWDQSAARLLATLRDAIAQFQARRAA